MDIRNFFGGNMVKNKKNVENDKKKITAENIAKQVGIISDSQGGKVMEAAEFIKVLEEKGLLK